MHAVDRRIGLLFGAFLVLLAIAGLRAADLGVFRSDALSRFASAQSVDRKVIPAVRGMITDRSGQVLAISESADTVTANPLILTHPDTVARELAPLLGMSVAKVRTAITKPNTGYSVIAYDVPSSTATRIADLVRTQGINGIDSTSEPVEKRVYPLGATASQVLGWVNGSGVGASGVEYVLNEKLKGHAGATRVVEDGKQQAIGVDQVTRMKPGDHIALTLSVPLQQEAEQALAAMQARYGGTSATAIVTNPQTGQILADANWPSSDSNHISSLAGTQDESVGLSYEPGSTFKAVTIAGGLMDGTITPDTEIGVPSCLVVPDDNGLCIHDAEDHPDETATVSQILKVSSNIGADRIAQMDGPENGAIRLNAWMHRFGFGRATGVALNGEADGVLTPLKLYSGATMYNEPFGQGEEVTPMQMVQFYDAIANGGILRTPQILYSVNGRRTLEPAGTRVMSPKVAEELRMMMRGVFGDGGTASGAQIPGYDLAGKTGTAQDVVHGKYSDSLYTASFVGMVPAKNPKLLVMVVDDQVTNGFGGQVAGSAFQRIVGWAVPHLGIAPCDGTCPASANATATPSTP